MFGGTLLMTVPLFQNRALPEQSLCLTRLVALPDFAEPAALDKAARPSPKWGRMDSPRPETADNPRRRPAQRAQPTAAHPTESASAARKDARSESNATREAARARRSKEEMQGRASGESECNGSF